ncbi:MAG: hypothetical protein J6V44_03670 [Methanobrevibacter sp.]|nr:hypothetical protein [Methanobrevibacter sp.]
MSWYGDIASFGSNVWKGATSVFHSIFPSSEKKGRDAAAQARTSSSKSGPSGSSNSSGGSGGSGSGGSGSDASGAGGGSTASTDNTNENVKVNDPEKNKKLAEVRMSEEFRDTFSFTLKIPSILKGLHTNSWFFMQVADDFYESNYPTIARKIGDEKFGRYAGFEPNRFFVDKIVERGGVDGVSMEITLNPLAPNYGQYIKMQQEAEKALVDALNDTASYSGTNTNLGAGGSVNSTDIIGIGNELASKYTFCSGQAQSYTDMKKSGCGSCFAWSGALYTELTAKGYQARVVQYGTNQAWNHRSVEIYDNGQWVDYPYRSTNIPRNARNTNNRNRFVISESTLKSIL